MASMVPLKQILGLMAHQADPVEYNNLTKSFLAGRLSSDSVGPFLGMATLQKI